MSELCTQRDLCVAGGCDVLAAIAAQGLTPDIVLGAARSAAGLPYSFCETGPQESKPSRGVEPWQYCGERPEVQVAARAIVNYAATQTAPANITG